MAGIYIHIPFCKKACTYCDFHFSTGLGNQGDMVKSIQQELEIRKDYLGRESINSIYFGGGTPSLLKMEELDSIFNTLYNHYSVSETSEITIEANPDDLKIEKIKGFKHSPINRFSVGIQSFHEEDLQWMNRSHNSQQAEFCIKSLQNEGYSNISLDLIFGYPLLNQNKWKLNLEKAIELNVPHISSYGMTIEKGTLLDHQISLRLTNEIDEEIYISQFNYLIDTLQKAGLEQYELSNYAKSGFESQHNQSYWNRVPYLGIGPSAHSYNGTTRSWNISNNTHYIKKINNGELPSKFETLTEENKFQEYIMTALRTTRGIDLVYLKNSFPEQWGVEIEKNYQVFLSSKDLEKNGNKLFLTKKGKVLSDYILKSLIQ